MKLELQKMEASITAEWSDEKNGFIVKVKQVDNYGKRRYEGESTFFIYDECDEYIMPIALLALNGCYPFSPEPIKRLEGEEEFKCFEEV